MVFILTAMLLRGSTLKKIKITTGGFFKKIKSFRKGSVPIFHKGGGKVFFKATFNFFKYPLRGHFSSHQKSKIKISDFL